MAPVGDVEAMAEGAIHILRDTATWRRFSAAARQSAVERYGVGRVIPQYERYYERIASGIDVPAPEAGAPIPAAAGAG